MGTARRAKELTQLHSSLFAAAGLRNGDVPLLGSRVRVFEAAAPAHDCAAAALITSNGPEIPGICKMLVWGTMFLLHFKLGSKSGTKTILHFKWGWILQKVGIRF